MAELTLEARDYRRERGRLLAVVTVGLADGPLDSDTLNLDDADARARFSDAVRERLNGQHALAADLDARLIRLGADVAAHERRAEEADRFDRASQADRLVELAESAVLFHDALGDGYARLSHAGHWETWPIRSLGLRRWLAARFWQRYHKAPNSEALSSALGVLEGQALYEGAAAAVYLRSAPDGAGGLYLDLGDSTWQAVHVTLHGWRPVGQPPVNFRRAAGLLPLPVPEPGGKLDALRPLVNVADDDDWALLLAWLAAALREQGPHPPLALYGQQGSAKTTTARLLRALVDPAKPDLRSDPRELRDVAIGARNNWVLAFDNVSHVTPWLSDALCRLATGGGWATRQNYTDLDEVLFDARRPVLLTGITEYITRPDLLDCAVQLTLPPIPKRRRRPEAAVWREFEQLRPRLLGALLDTVAGAIREGPRVRLPGLPRMADFAAWAVAAEQGRGEPARFLAVYTAHAASSHQQALEASAIGPILLAWLSGETALGPWQGTAGDLLEALNAQAGSKTQQAKGWPKTARGLRAELQRLAPALYGMGYLVEFPKADTREGHERARLLTITARDDGDDAGDDPTDDAAPDAPEEEAAGPSAPSAEAAGPCPDKENGADGCADDVPTEPSAPADDCSAARSVADDVAGEIDRAGSCAGAEERPLADGADDCAVHFSAGARAPAYTLLTSPADVATALPVLLAAPMLGLDTETTGLDPLRDRVRLVQLATPERVYILDSFLCDPRALAPVLTQAPRLVGHNLKFDLHMLASTGLPMPDGARLLDTQLAAQLLGAGTRDGYLDRCGLADVIARLLGETLDKSEQRSDWSSLLTASQLTYAARDAAILLPLAARVEADLAAAKLVDVAALEMRALPALVWLEQRGAPFDAEAWAALSDAAVAEQVQLEDALTAEVGATDLFGHGTINWASPPQALAVLRGRGHALERTDELTLRALADREPLARLLLAYREASRKASTYGIEFVQKHVHPVTGRVHADYLQLGSVAGRMSCQRPNLQQVPRDPAYRACFRAPAGRVLVKADYSQIELRIAAELTGDPRMLAAYQRGEDLHAVTAAAVLGCAVAAVDKEGRQLAKALNFGLLYGMGADRLQEHAATNYGVQFTEVEARAFRDRFFAVYPGLRRWHRSQVAEPIETRTLAGRRRLAVARFTEKLNTPVQGTGADGLKAALALLWERRECCPSAAPVLCVHDEIVVECDAAAAASARAWLVDAMRDGMARYLQRVPVEVEAMIGPDWSMGA